MISVLEFIKNCMNETGLPYCFMRWNKKQIPNPYYVGEISQVPISTEDGGEEYAFILTGFTRGDWVRLLTDQETIKKKFPSIDGLTAILEDGSSIAVFYTSSLLLNFENEEVKRVQHNIQIKLWKAV